MFPASVKPNSQTFAILLTACANLAALEQDKEVHAIIVRGGCEFDVSLRKALTDVCKMWDNGECLLCFSQNASSQICSLLE